MIPKEGYWWAQDKDDPRNQPFIVEIHRDVLGDLMVWQIGNEFDDNLDVFTLLYPITPYSAGEYEQYRVENTH